MPSVGPEQVLVLGAGVTGLTTAIVLAEVGRPVRLRSAVPPGETTSAAASAMWGPSGAELFALLERWTRETGAALTSLAADRETRVRVTRGLIARRADAAVAWTSCPAFTSASRTSCRPGSRPASTATSRSNLMITG